MTRHIGTQVRLMRSLGNHAVSGHTTDIGTEIRVPPRAAPEWPAAASLTALPAPTAAVGEEQSGRMLRARLERSLHEADTARPACDALSGPRRVSTERDTVRYRARCASLLATVPGSL